VNTKTTTTSPLDLEYEIYAEVSFKKTAKLLQIKLESNETNKKNELNAASSSAAAATTTKTSARTINDVNNNHQKYFTTFFSNLIACAINLMDEKEDNSTFKQSCLQIYLSNNNNDFLDLLKKSIYMIVLLAIIFLLVFLVYLIVCYFWKTSERREVYGKFDIKKNNLEMSRTMSEHSDLVENKNNVIMIRLTPLSQNDIPMSIVKEVNQLNEKKSNQKAEHRKGEQSKQRDFKCFSFLIKKNHNSIIQSNLATENTYL
jgi:hypothetical protein